MFVFVDVKVGKVEKVELDGFLDGVQAIQDGNAIFGPAVRSISAMANELCKNITTKISADANKDYVNSPKR